MNNDTLLEDSYDNTSDNLSDEFNYINNNENNDSKYYELEKFLINEIKDSIPIKNYENILYRELDIDNVGAFQYIDELELIFNKNLKDKHRNNILKEFYTVIKDAIIKFNNGLIKLVAHDTDMKIPIFNTLYNNKNYKIKSSKINFKLLNDLNLNLVNLKKYPLVKILNFVPKTDTLFETLLVSVNDELVDLFLKNKISFDEISTKLKQIISHKDFLKYRQKKLNNLTQIEKLNEFVRLKTKSLSVISQQR